MGLILGLVVGCYSDSFVCDYSCWCVVVVVVVVVTGEMPPHSVVRVAAYGSWVGPKRAVLSAVSGPRSGHVLSTNEPQQGLFGSGQRRPLPPVLSHLHKPTTS